MQENTSQSLEKTHEHCDFAEIKASDPEQNHAYDQAADMSIWELNFKNWNHFHAQPPYSEFQ